MRKSLFITMLLASLISFAQGTLEKGNVQLNAGVGLSGWGLPVYVGLDVGVAKNFTMGGEFSYRGYSNEYGYYKYNYGVTGIHLNGNYHFNEVLDLPRKWDIYAGGSLGYYIWNHTYKYHGPYDDPYYKHNYAGTSGLGLGLQVGTRYFFTNKFGINFELGGGSVFGGKLGITLKFGGGASKNSRTSTTSSKTTSTKKTIKKTSKRK